MAKQIKKRIIQKTTADKSFGKCEEPVVSTCFPLLGVTVLGNSRRNKKKKNRKRRLKGREIKIHRRAGKDRTWRAARVRAMAIIHCDF